MAIFQTVKLNWRERDITIPADRVMGAICVVEDVVTFPELVSALQLGKPNLSKLARAYAALLRYSGVTVDDDEVYAGMFVPGKLQAEITSAVNTLMVLMTPPDAIKNAAAFKDAAIEAETSPGNVKAVNPSKSSKRSSKRR